MATMLSFMTDGPPSLGSIRNRPFWHSMPFGWAVHTISNRRLAGSISAVNVYWMPAPAGMTVWGWDAPEQPDSS
ncbi:MAG: hypothetical protein WBO23_07815, partial [Burkholderiales bacterium]